MLKDAVKLAQSMLAVVFPSIEVDGVWGKDTEAAFSAASRNLQETINDATRRWENISIDEIRRRSRRFVVAETGGGAVVVYRKQQVRQPTSKIVLSQSTFITKEAAIGLARKYNSAAGLPMGTLEFMLAIEAPRAAGGYNPSGRGGAGNRYLGLYQFYDVAKMSWADGQRWARTFGVQVPPMYPNGWSSAEWNTACAAGYAVMNAKLLRDANIPVTKETLYACHQQGAGGFKQSVKAKKFGYAGKQSSDSIVVLRSAFDQAVA